MTRHAFRAMGTSFVVRTTGDPRRAERRVSEAEDRLSRFLPASELSRLNADPTTRPSLSPDLAEIMGIASELRARTDGLVDIGVGEAVAAGGYDRSLDAGLPAVGHPGNLAQPTWSYEAGQLERAAGGAFDLGGIAKGWICDRLVDEGLATVASAGGDMRSIDPRLVADVEAGATVIEIPVGVGALATSSTLDRRWTAANRSVSHLIHPVTMEPVRSPIVSATAIASTAVEAEAGAKAVLLKGVDGLAWAAAQTWIRMAIATWHDGSVFATTQREAA